MAYVPKKTDAPVETQHKIRITLTSRNVRALENVSDNLLRAAKNRQVTVRGPVRMPTKTLKITTRKTPCGEGSKTWDRFEMRIHKRVIDLHASAEIVKEITTVRLDPGVDIEVTLGQA
jgi:small subunit ribosomal protein S20e